MKRLNISKQHYFLSSFLDLNNYVIAHVERFILSFQIMLFLSQMSSLNEINDYPSICLLFHVHVVKIIWKPYIQSK